MTRPCLVISIVSPLLHPREHRTRVVGELTDGHRAHASLQMCAQQLICTYMSSASACWTARSGRPLG